MKQSKTSRGRSLRKNPKKPIIWGFLAETGTDPVTELAPTQKDTDDWQTAVALLKSMAEQYTDPMKNARVTDLFAAQINFEKYSRKNPILGDNPIAFLAAQYRGNTPGLSGFLTFPASIIDAMGVNDAEPGTRQAMLATIADAVYRDLAAELSIALEEWDQVSHAYGHFMEEIGDDPSVDASIEREAAARDVRAARSKFQNLLRSILGSTEIQANVRRRR